MNPKNVTIKDIAEALNVSVGTVDRAIHNRGRIREETRVLVMKKVEELGYKPNKIARALAKVGVTKFAFVTPAHNRFWKELISGAQTACNELSDFGLQIDFYHQQSDYDSINQSKQEEEIITTMPAGIILAPLHQYLSLGPINHAVDKGIPVITVNIDAPASKRICYVGENAIYAGSLVGDLFGRFMGGKGDLVILLGSRDLSQFQDREKGFLQVLKSKYPNIRIVGRYQFGDSEEVAYELAKGLILDKPDLKGIFANTAIGAIAIGKAISDTGRINDIVSVSYDINETIFNLLDKNAILATVTQSPYLQGYNAVKLLHRVVFEQKPPEEEFN